MAGRRKGVPLPVPFELRLALRQVMANDQIRSYPDLVQKMAEWAKMQKLDFTPPHPTSVRRVLEPDPDGEDVVTKCTFLYVLRGTLGMKEKTKYEEGTDFEVALHRDDIKLLRMMKEIRSLGSPLQADVMAAAERAFGATLELQQRRIADARKLLTTLSDEPTAPSPAKSARR
jgi:hypothetical protein